MFEKVAIKNPGCQFCRYFVPQFEYNGKPTTEACTKTAWKMFEKNPPSTRKRKWKWSTCDYAAEKNKDRLCKDFQIQSTTRKLIEKLHLAIRGTGEQHPPTFSGEIWWD